MKNAGAILIGGGVTLLVGYFVYIRLIVGKKVKNRAQADKIILDAWGVVVPSSWADDYVIARAQATIDGKKFFTSIDGTKTYLTQTGKQTTNTK